MASNASRAISTYMTYLMHKASASSSWELLCDIKEFPDLGSAPNTIDVTTLSDPQKMYLNDIFDPGNLEFSTNYNAQDYEKLSALKGKQEDYAIWFGASEVAGERTPDGNKGKFEFKGELAVWVKGGSVSAAVDMGISIAPSTEIKKVSASE